MTEPISPPAKIKKLSSPLVPKTTPDKTSEPTISAALPTTIKNPKSSSSTASSSSQASKSSISNKPALSIQPNSLELQQLLFVDNSALEYMVEENISVPAYTPTSKEDIRLKGMAQSQKQRVYLNVGGTKFETSVPTLQSDPSSLLARMILPSSPLKPYAVDKIYTYFPDRDPKLFAFILNYLRYGADLPINFIPAELPLLFALQREAQFFCLSGLENLLQEKIVQHDKQK
jgi:hypothetical protein